MAPGGTKSASYCIANLCVKTERKSNRTVMIMEKPVDMSSPTVAGASGGGGVKLASSAVQDEKTLMKLQSSSTLKYT